MTASLAAYALVTLALAAVLAWTLTRDWHRHTWDRRVLVTWTRPGWSVNGLPFGMQVQGLVAHCTGCHAPSTAMLGPGWTVYQGVPNR